MFSYYGHPMSKPRSYLKARSLYPNVHMPFYHFLLNMWFLIIWVIHDFTYVSRYFRRSMSCLAFKVIRDQSWFKSPPILLPLGPSIITVDLFWLGRYHVDIGQIFIQKLTVNNHCMCFFYQVIFTIQVIRDQMSSWHLKAHPRLLLCSLKLVVCSYSMCDVNQCSLEWFWMRSGSTRSAVICILLCCRRFCYC